MRCGGILRGEWAFTWGARLVELMGNRSGGVYVYYWPRGAPNIPDDVKVSRNQHVVEILTPSRTPIPARPTASIGVNPVPTCPSPAADPTSTTTSSSSTSPSVATSEWPPTFPWPISLRFMDIASGRR